jgi:hypothetical protein
MELGARITQNGNTIILVRSNGIKESQSSEYT